MVKKVKMKLKMKLKKGDKVVIIAGKDKGKEGKILVVDRSKNRVIVEGANKMKKHIKPGRSKMFQQGGITELEAPIHASNVMYLHKGKPTKIGIKETTEEKNGKKKIVRKRVAKSTGEVID